MESGWIVDLVTGWGAVGVGLLMLLENVFPPIPSELVMPLAGYAAARGQLSPVLALAAGTAGSVAGAYGWYLVGRWATLDWLKGLAASHGRWLTLTPRDIDAADAWFDKHGQKAVFFCRMIPGIRTLISVPAGLSCMKRGPFLVATVAGSAIWSGALFAAGYWLGAEYEDVSRWVGWVSMAILALAVGWYLWRVATWNPDRAPGRRRGSAEARR